jgi:hypothetical protein
LQLAEIRRSNAAPPKRKIYIFVDGNDRRPSGVERYGFNFSAGNTGFLQRATGSRGEGLHVIHM